LSYNKQTVLDAFNQLDSLWQGWSAKNEGNNFWHVANTLDTCVEYILKASRRWGDQLDARQKVQGMIEKSYQIISDVLESGSVNNFEPGFWWDDFGWWGITFHKIYNYYDLIFKGANAPKVTKDNCLIVAQECWRILKDISSDKVNSSIMAPYKGPIAGGCWNNWPIKEVDGEQKELGGEQNTVTNALFLVLASRLSQVTQNTEYLESAANQYLWFRDWFANYLEKQAECPHPGPQEGLFRCLYRGTAELKVLAYERPHDPNNSTYNNGAGGTLIYVPEQLWTGDQGLLLGGLEALLEQQNAISNLKVIRDRDPGFPFYVNMIASAVSMSVKEFFDTSGVLHEAELNGPGATQFAVDYATGKGVLLRYIEYAQKVLVKTELIVATAQAIATIVETDPDRQIGFQWSNLNSKIGTNENMITVGDDSLWKVTLQSAGLDALTAAIPYIP
jgi:hypothetical protein